MKLSEHHAFRPARPELEESKQRSLTAEISQVPRQGGLSGLRCVQDLTPHTPPPPEKTVAQSAVRFPFLIR